MEPSKAKDINVRFNSNQQNIQTCKDRIHNKEYKQKLFYCLCEIATDISEYMVN